MHCAIVAGGMGTRLRSIVGDVPKPMALIGGIPLLEHLIALCRRFEITDIHLLLAYKPEVIRTRFGDGSGFGVRLTYFVEKEPQGTAGCMRPLLPSISDEGLLVLYGDVFVDMDLSRLFDFHRRRQPTATLVVHPNDHPHDSDLIEVDEEDRITAFLKKPRPEGAYYSNKVNAGVYVLSPRILSLIPDDRESDFGQDVFPSCVAAGEVLVAYNTPEYIKDMGTPERYNKVNQDLLAGIPARCNLVKSRPAVFLDRDGTLNTLVPLLNRLEDLELYPGAAEAVRMLNSSEYLAVLVTNQPQVARGLITTGQLTAIHNKLETLLAREGAKLDAIYFCPHHPDAGFEEEVRELKIQCRCRKPGTLLYEKAAKRFNIDLAASFVVGDSFRDLQAARNLGSRAVLVQTGLQGSDVSSELRPDYRGRDLGDAVTWILGGKS